MPSVVNYVLLSQIQRDIQYEQPYFSAIRARGRPGDNPLPGSAHGTYAGSIQQRLKDLQEAMDDEKAKVILCSRGGYGAVHLVGQLDFTRFRQHPKWLIGFSDITALHNVFQQNGFASLHAPMARHLTVEPEDDFCCQALKDILFGNTAGRNLVQLYLPGTQAQPQRRGNGHPSGRKPGGALRAARHAL